MREIKFRAWDIAYKLYRIVDGNNLFIADNEIYDYDCSRSPEMKYVTKDYILEQFTGLNDKNGVEIYEGDIVAIKVYDENKRLVGPIERRNGGAYWIKHQEACDKYLHQIHCEVCETTSSVSLLDFFDSYQLNVIGNIHENPELLKQNGDVGK